MIALTARYDGKVIVPDEPLALPANQRVRISVEPIVPQQRKSPRTDFSEWIGLGLPLPEDHSPRFTSNDDLWDTNK